jgi:hypothetical protein
MSPTSYINTFHLRLRITQPGNRTDRDRLFDFAEERAARNVPGPSPTSKAT